MSYIISSASYIDGNLEVHRIMTASTMEEAITKAQDNIAEDFGYDSWEEYLEHADPRIVEKNGLYKLHDENCGHEEMYLIEEA